MEQYNYMFEYADRLCELADANITFPLVNYTGISVISLRLLLIVLIQQPLGWFFHYCVHGTRTRHAFNIVVGFALQNFFYRDMIIHVWILTGVAYLLMVVIPRQR